MQKNYISVIVCTYNRAEMLRLALESLVNQETNWTFSYEVLVIDDASTDDTRSVVSKFSQSSRVPIRYVLEEGKGIACARNRGLQESCSEWVAFFDDDQLAESSWLKELLACASEKKTWCVGGKRLLRLSEQHIASLSRMCRKLLGEMDLGNMPKKCGHKEFPAAGNVLLKRSVFDTVGQFDESLTRGGEDTDLTRRMQKAGLEAWYTPRSVAYHMITPYRLEESYLFWASLRVGDNFAHRDFLKGGLPRTTFACLARIGQAFLITLPRLLWAYLSGNIGEVLGQKCLLLRAIGYTSHTLHLLAPRLLPQEGFFARLEFRKERKIFSKNFLSNGKRTT